MVFYQSVDGRRYAHECVSSAWCSSDHFVLIGRGAIIGAMAGAKSDVIAYGMVMSRPGLLAGLNLVGLKRAGVDSKEIQDLLKAYDELFRADGTFAERIDAVAAR